VSSLERILGQLKLRSTVDVIVRDKDGSVKQHVRVGLEEGEPPTVYELALKVLDWLEALSKTSKDQADDPPAALPQGATPTIEPLYYFRKNLVTDVGLAEIIKLVFGLGGTPFKYVAIGTGTTAESASDTALQAELKRKQATVTQVTVTVPNDAAQLEATFSSADGLTGTQSIAEAGIFNAATGGVLLARKTFTPVTVNFGAGDSITIRYVVQATR